MDAADELTAHMKKEELLLFPYVRAIDSSAKGAKRPENSAFKSVKELIDSMKDEHTQEGDRFARISMLSNGYTPPEDACKTYRATYVLLQEFEEDLHRHIHLENNILFPKALEFEKSIRI
jgi:regulator of cell morphogenesis and NO signaling